MPHQHHFFVLQDGVFAFGPTNNFCQLAAPKGTTGLLEVDTRKWSECNVRRVRQNDFGSVFLMEDGSVFNCGLELGSGFSTFAVPRPIRLPGRVCTIATSGRHCMFLLESGELFGVGNNGYRQLFTGDGIGRSTPARAKFEALCFPDNAVKRVTCKNASTMLVMVSGEVWVVGGSNLYGELGVGYVGAEKTPKSLRVSEWSGAGVRRICCGGHHTLFEMEDDSVFGCGRNASGEAGLGLQESVLRPQRVQFPESVKDPRVMRVAVGSTFSVFMMRSGEIFASGRSLLEPRGVAEEAWGIPTRIELPGDVDRVHCLEMAAMFYMVNGEVLVLGQGSVVSLATQHESKATTVPLQFPLPAPLRGSYQWKKETTRWLRPDVRNAICAIVMTHAIGAAEDVPLSRIPVELVEQILSEVASWPVEHIAPPSAPPSPALSFRPRPRASTTLPSSDGSADASLDGEESMESRLRRWSAAFDQRRVQSNLMAQAKDGAPAVSSRVLLSARKPSRRSARIREKANTEKEAPREQRRGREGVEKETGDESGTGQPGQSTEDASAQESHAGKKRKRELDRGASKRRKRA